MTENLRDVEFTCAIKVPDERVSLFNKLREQTEKELKENGYTWTTSGLAANEKLNRYRDVSAYDHTRIILHRGESDYINANLITVQQSERQYILTQGPLKNTVGHFWLMVWEQNSRAVLMLNNIIENSQAKCHKYWPDINERVLTLPEVHLSVEFLFSEDYMNFSKRTFRIIDHKTGLTREIMQFHYTTWPDFSTPKLKDFLTFLWEVRASGALDNQVGPAVVHCSAGIGRSGTFCLVDSSLVIIEKEGDQNISIVNLLIEMRRSRMGLIQTPNQLIFSFEAIIEGVKNIRDPNFNGYELENIPPPLPPPRFASLSGTTTVHDNYMLNHIDRALPEVPGNGSSNSDDDDDDEVNDNDDDDDDDIEDDDSDEAIGILNTGDACYRYIEEDEENVEEDEKANNDGDNEEKINQLLENIIKDDRVLAVDNNINANIDIKECSNREVHANDLASSKRFSEDISQNHNDLNQTMYNNNNFTNGKNDIQSQSPPPPPSMKPIKMNAEFNSSEHLLNDGSRSVNEAVLRRRNVRHVRLATMQAKVKEIKTKQRASERKTAFGSKKSLLILTATVIIVAFCLYKYSNIFNFTNSSTVTNGNNDDDFIFVKHLSDDYHDGRDNDAGVKNVPTVNDMKRKHIIGDHATPKRRSDNDEVLQKRDDNDEAAVDDSLETTKIISSVNDKKRKHTDSEDKIKSSSDNHSSLLIIAATAVVCVICAYAYSKFTTTSASH